MSYQTATDELTSTAKRLVRELNCAFLKFERFKDQVSFNYFFAGDKTVGVDVREEGTTITLENLSTKEALLVLSLVRNFDK